jgi:hypothetical protein
MIRAGSSKRAGMLSTVDLLIRTGCFVEKVNNIFDTNEVDLN